MTGIVGGTTTGTELASLADSLYAEDWYRTRTVEKADRGIALVEHGDTDDRSNRLWDGDGGIGVVHGVISAAEPHSGDPDDLFPDILAEPTAVLPALEGPFVIACFDTDRDRAVVATDKAGSRPCYYTTNGGLYVSSEVKGLLPLTPDPTIDEAAVGDLLLLGWVAGEKTLVEEINTLPPASVLVYSDGKVTVDRYWEPTVGPLPAGDYPRRWLGAFREAVEDVSRTTGSDLGLWLSGGIDSRATAAVLREVDCDFETLTYWDKNGRNPALATEVADRLGVDNTLLEPTSPEQFVDGVRRGVAVTDGMISWSRLVNLSFTFDALHERTDVVLEGPTFMGEDVWQYFVQNGTSPVDALLRKKGKLPVEDVESLLAGSIAPTETLETAVASGKDSSHRFQLLDTMRRFYAYSHMRSNIVQRSQVGTRTFTHGSILETTLRMPGKYRMRTVPFTSGRIPAGVPRIKLAVMRRLDHGLDEIPWDRTNRAPTAPYAAHVAGFALNEVRDALGSGKTHRYLEWYHDEPTVRRFIDRTLDDACRRPFLREDALEDLRRRVLDGEDGLIPLASITGLELWIQQCLE